MNAKFFSNTLLAVALTSATLMAGPVQADSGYFSVTFGDRGPVGSPFYQGRHHERHGPGWHAVDTRANFVDARQDWQMARIQEGLRSGDLTRFEARALLRDQHAIDRLERHFLADGRLDGYERQRLDASLDAAGRRIYAEMTDRQERDSDWSHRQHRGEWR